MTIAVLRSPRMTNPVDVLEGIATQNDWAFERASDDELTLVVAGSWCDYQLSLNWRRDLETLHVASAFEMKVPTNRLAEVYKLIALINEQMWLGHFDVWTGEGLVMFRHGLMLHGTKATPQQCEALLEAALSACERYYQAFQYVVWAGKDAPEALKGTMFQTEGEA